MYYYINDFENRTPSNIKYETIYLNCGNSINVYQIENVHDLIQFIGYGKYANKDIGNVLIRGQTSIYKGKMIPSLYRGKSRIDKITYKYNERINQIIENTKKFNQYDRSVFEPMIQHYGVKTPYFDLVDNVWVALWFALHQAKIVPIRSHDYVFYHESNESYAYIVLMVSDAIEETGRYGVYQGSSTTLVDLRKAIPSYFLRPHAQHAYMIRMNKDFPDDYSDLIIGIAKIPTNIGLKWLGSNEFLSLSSLFPASYFDFGYRTLLNHFPEIKHDLIGEFGSIQILTD